MVNLTLVTRSALVEEDSLQITDFLSTASGLMFSEVVEALLHMQLSCEEHQLFHMDYSICTL